jgi:hypothetical protein
VCFEASFQAELLRILDPSSLAASSAKEDVDNGDSQSDVASYTNNKDEESSTNHHSHQSVSTLGDFDPTEGRSGGPPALTPRNSFNPSSHQSTTGNNGSRTYHENQFEMILSNNVVKLSELRNWMEWHPGMID